MTGIVAGSALAPGVDEDDVEDNEAEEEEDEEEEVELVAAADCVGLGRLLAQRCRRKVSTRHNRPPDDLSGETTRHTALNWAWNSCANNESTCGVRSASSIHTMFMKLLPMCLCLLRIASASDANRDAGMSVVTWNAICATEEACQRKKKAEM